MISAPFAEPSRWSQQLLAGLAATGVDALVLDSLELMVDVVLDSAENRTLQSWNLPVAPPPTALRRASLNRGGIEVGTSSSARPSTALSVPAAGGRQSASRDHLLARARPGSAAPARRRSFKQLGAAPAHTISNLNHSPSTTPSSWPFPGRGVSVESWKPSIASPQPRVLAVPAERSSVSHGLEACGGLAAEVDEAVQRLLTSSPLDLRVDANAFVQILSDHFRRVLKNVMDQYPACGVPLVQLWWALVFIATNQRGSGPNDAERAAAQEESASLHHRIMELEQELREVSARHSDDLDAARAALDLAEQQLKTAQVKPAHGRADGLPTKLDTLRLVQSVHGSRMQQVSVDLQSCVMTRRRDAQPVCCRDLIADWEDQSAVQAQALKAADAALCSLTSLGERWSSRQETCDKEVQTVPTLLSLPMHLSVQVSSSPGSGRRLTADESPSPNTPVSESGAFIKRLLRRRDSIFPGLASRYACTASQSSVLGLFATLSCTRC
jgi:hypothetical protein